jgi:hypothetical protein
MEYVSFTNAVYSRADNSAIDLDLVLTEGADPIPYTASSDDPVSAGLFAAIVSRGGISAYKAPVVTLVERAAAAIAEGLTITLSGSVTLSATVFPTDPTTTIKIGQVVTAINATGGFPGGAEAYPIKDASGSWHSFTVPQYKAVAAAIAGFVGQLDLIIDGNPLNATELPANSIALAV